MDINSPENVTVIDGYSLANPFERVIAFIVDILVYCAIYFLMFYALSPIGQSWLAGTAILYLLFRDCFSFLNYQSIGKKIMKLRVIKTNDKTKINPLVSLKRNFIFLPNLSLAFGVSFIYTMGTITFILILLELYLLYTSTDNQRLGDLFADTLVIENSL